MADSIEKTMKPIFFATPSEFRAWFEEHHATSQEVWVAFYKKDSGRSDLFALST